MSLLSAENISADGDADLKEIKRRIKENRKLLSLYVENLIHLNTCGYRVTRGFIRRDGNRYAKRKNFAQGSLEITGSFLDLAIAGRGFFQLKDKKGNIYYTRNGQLMLNKDYELAHINGSVLEPRVVVKKSCDLHAVRIQQNGEVYCNDNRIGKKIQLNSINIFYFVNLDGLRPVGPYCFKKAIYPVRLCLMKKRETIPSTRACLNSLRWICRDSGS